MHSFFKSCWTVVGERIVILLPNCINRWISPKVYNAVAFIVIVSCVFAIMFNWSPSQSVRSLKHSLLAINSSVIVSEKFKQQLNDYNLSYAIVAEQRLGYCVSRNSKWLSLLNSSEDYQHYQEVQTRQ